jgi:hypothetical protein
MHDTWTVRCKGGPLDGQQVTVRSYDGFLAADKANNKSWVYTRQPDDVFEVCVAHDDSLSYPDGLTTGERTLDEGRAWAAGLNSTLDVLAISED